MSEIDFSGDPLSRGNSAVSYFDIAGSKYIGIEISEESRTLLEGLIDLPGDGDETERVKDGMRFLCFREGSKAYEFLEMCYRKRGRDASAVGH